MTLTGGQVQVQLVPDEASVVVDVGVDRDFADENCARGGPGYDLDHVVVERALNQSGNISFKIKDHTCGDQVLERNPSKEVTL